MTTPAVYTANVPVRCWLLLACMLTIGTTIGQTDEIEFVNQKPIDEHRYNDIKGSPLYFEDWVVGDIMRNDAFIFKDILLNYNGYTKTFEVKIADRMIELEGKQYLRVDVDIADNPGLRDEILTDDFAFQRNLHPRFADRFVVILFHQNDFMLIKDIEIDIAKTTVQNPGQAVHFKDFNVKSIYYLKSPAGLEQLKLKKKHIETVFNDPRVVDFINEEGLKFKSEGDLVKVVKFCSELNGG